MLITLYDCIVYSYIIIFTFAPEMSKRPEQAILIEHAAIVQPVNLNVQTVYTMAYTKDINKLFRKLGRPTLNLAFYLSDEHGDNEDFYYNKFFVEKFHKHLAEHGIVPYHKMTIEKSLKLLKKEGFVLKVYRGVYAVNPKFYYRNDPNLRTTWIKKLYERANDYQPVDINKHNEATK